MIQGEREREEGTASSAPSLKRSSRTGSSSTTDESWKEERRVCYVKARIKGQKKMAVLITLCQVTRFLAIKYPLQRRKKWLSSPAWPPRTEEGRKAGMARSNREIIRGATRVIGKKMFRVGKV